MEGLRKTIKNLTQDTNWSKIWKLGPPDTKQENYINLQLLESTNSSF